MLRLESAWSRALTLLSAARLDQERRWRSDLELLRWPHNCLACALVIVEFLRLIASVFPLEFAYGPSH